MPGQFANATDEIDTVLLVSRHGRTQNLIQKVHGQDCTLIVSAVDPNGTDSAIRIDSRPGGPLRVSFTDSEYRPDAVEGVRLNTVRSLGLVTLINNATPTRPETFRVDPTGHVDIFNSQP
jgi:hypothetical protein